jgi:hypothetical protein
MPRLPLRLPRLGWDRWFLPTLLILRFAVGVWYSVSIPLWEPFDELAHYEYANYIATHRSLLRPQDPAAERIWERFQPPLYYLLLAGAIAGIDRSDAGGPDGSQLLRVHALDESFPYRGTALAAHLGRLLSVALSTAATYFAYRAAQLVFPGRPLPAAAASVLFAFWPQFLATGSIMNNDALVVTLSTIALFYMVRLVSGPAKLAEAIALAATLGAALLTKLNGLGLVPAVLATLVVMVVRLRRQWSLWSQGIALGAIALGALVSWYLLGSFPYLYVPLLDGALSTGAGELLSFSPQALEAALSVLAAAFSYTGPTYFGVIGNVPLSDGHYRAGLLLVLAGLAGSLFLVIRRKAPPMPVAVVLVLHALGFAALGFALAYASRDIYLFPGRYMLPNLASVAVLLTYGWGLAAPPRAGAAVLIALSAGLMTIALAIPPTVITPAHPQPSVTAPGTIQPQERPHVRFGDAIELIGYDVRPWAVEPGKAIDLTFYFQPLRAIEKDYTLLIELVGPGYLGVSGGVHVSYPGRGSAPTSRWEPGTIIVVPYRVYAPLNFPAPSLLRFRLALLESPLGPPLPARDPSGRDVTDVLYLGALKVRSPEQRAAPSPSSWADFADGVRLLSVTPGPLEGGQVSVTLRWFVLERPSRDYTAFIHIKDGSGRLIGQEDAPPQGGWYPTSFWEPGEVLTDRYAVRLVAPEHCGPTSVVVGLYDPSTLARLPVRDETGQELPDGEVPAALFTIPCH